MDPKIKAAYLQLFDEFFLPLIRTNKYWNANYDFINEKNDWDRPHSFAVHSILTKFEKERGIPQTNADGSYKFSDPIGFKNYVMIPPVRCWWDLIGAMWYLKSDEKYYDTMQRVYADFWLTMDHPDHQYKFESYEGMDEDILKWLWEIGMSKRFDYEEFFFNPYSVFSKVRLVEYFTYQADVDFDEPENMKPNEKKEKNEKKKPSFKDQEEFLKKLDEDYEKKFKDRMDELGITEYIVNYKIEQLSIE